MATIIEYPKQNVKYFAINNIYLRADLDTINQYCADNGYTYSTHSEEKQRFSNDGGVAYQYYGLPKGVETGSNEWITEFGFSKIVTSLTIE